MANSLRIVSYNCYGLNSSLVDFEQFDLIFLQETLLFRYELPLLCNIHPDFEGMGISACHCEEFLSVWKQSCKPRGDVTEGVMRTSRLRFKYALRQ